VPGTVLPPEGFSGIDNAGGRERRLVEREGRPADVLDALLYLVRSEFVTGEVLFVDGGRMLL
jgi:NAD(P)-dependent dehydrogenase (short-subunit alcohol dehydrogenase family)